MPRKPCHLLRLPPPPPQGALPRRSKWARRNPPTSMKPNPRSSSGSIASASLSKPAARPAPRNESMHGSRSSHAQEAPGAGRGETAVAAAPCCRRAQAAAGVPPASPSPSGLGKSRPHRRMRRLSGSGRVSLGNKPRRAARMPCRISSATQGAPGGGVGSGFGGEAGVCWSMQGPTPQQHPCTPNPPGGGTSPHPAGAGWAHWRWPAQTSFARQTWRSRPPHRPRPLSSAPSAAARSRGGAGVGRRIEGHAERRHPARWPLSSPRRLVSHTLSCRTRPMLQTVSGY